MAFFALFLVGVIVRGAFGRWTGKSAAISCGWDGIGKIENAQLGSEVRLGHEEGLRFVQRPPTEGL
ncbi:MAG TPA: hypothetical protein VJY34_02180, partial [Roseiarcus sp.]|nr:hypothetical protein [Roseiarcus sp.]